MKPDPVQLTLDEQVYVDQHGDEEDVNESEGQGTTQDQAQ